MPERTALIGVDWGTSSFRAFRLSPEGVVLERREGPYGILTVADGDFSAELRRRLGDWMQREQAPVLLSGMIGSRQGWIEAPYLTAPCSLDDLAAGLVRVPFAAADVRIVPGIEAATATMRDVMRGEEAQVFGALALAGGSGRFLLPGTHSKWVTAEGGRITGFSTYMTGEIYAATRDHTILGRLMADGEGNAASFLRGVREGARAGGPGALLHRLFAVRTAGLFGDVAAPDLADYLSGLLIGAEIADARGDAAAVRIVASQALARRYRAAAEVLDLAAEVVDPDCVATFYAAAARRAGLVEAGAVA